MLLYLTKYSRSDIRNINIELSKCIDGAAIGFGKVEGCEMCA